MLTVSPPDHREVPTVRLVSRAFMHDPYPALDALREGPAAAVPIVANGWRQWLLTRYDDVRQVLADRSFEREVAKRLQGGQAALVSPEKFARLPFEIRQGVIDRDGAAHDRLRALLADDFRRERMVELRPRIQQLADTLLDGLPPHEPADLIKGYSHPLAVTVIAELVGIPAADRQDFPVWWSSIHTGTSVAEVEDAGEQMYAFCRKMVAAKRAEPGEDVLTSLVNAERARHLTEHEVVSTLANLLIGGMESATAVANGLALLLSHPEQRVKVLADPRLLPGAVEEILRYEGPFRVLGPRISTHELDLDGVTIPAGELIALCPAAANRDPRQFTDPDTFDVARHPNPHLAFGHGMHHCIGIHLARMHAAIGLGAVLTRFPHSVLAVPWNELQWLPGPHQRQLRSLPVVLRPNR